jgi:hypothetical protein
MILARLRSALALTPRVALRRLPFHAPAAFPELNPLSPTRSPMHIPPYVRQRGYTILHSGSSVCLLLHRVLLSALVLPLGVALLLLARARHHPERVQLGEELVDVPELLRVAALGFARVQLHTTNKLSAISPSILCSTAARY